MEDERKTKKALIGELTAARQRIAESAAWEASQRQEADRLRRKAALDSVRLSVYKMEKASDIQDVLSGLHEALKVCGVVFDECSVQVVDEKRGHFTVAAAGPLEHAYFGPERSMPTPLRATAVYQAWRHRRPVYRKDLRKEDPYGERPTFERAQGGPIRSVLDVPFSQGTLAVNSTEPDAFSKADIETVGQLADVLSEAYERIEQIRRIEESEQLHRTIVERSKDVIFRLDLGGNCVLVSPAVRMLTGYPRTRFYANAALWHHIIFPEDIGRVERGREKALAGKISREVEFRLHRKDGRVRWAVETAYPVKDSEGRVIAIEGNIHDITRRKHAEEELGHERELLTALMDGSPDLIYFKDIEGRFIRVSKSFAHYLGIISPAEATGKTDFDFFSRTGSEKTRAEEKQIMETAQPVLGVEREQIWPKGRRWWASVTKVPLRDRHGKIVGIFGIARDITQRKHAEQKLLEHQEQLRSLTSELLLTEQRERRQLATELHDGVGQLLAISKIKLSALQDITTSPAVGSALDGIRGHIDESIRATRSLTLELSPPVLYEQGLVPALDWLAERTQEQIDTPVVFRDDGKPKSLDEDIAVFLFQATRELLVNVGKHANAQEVQVHVCRYGENVKITVEDDGVGFDPSGVVTRTDRDGGFGLFSIRERLDYVGGQLQISSKLGRGTRATLIAPLKHESQPQEGK